MPATPTRRPSSPGVVLLSFVAVLALLLGGGALLPGRASAADVPAPGAFVQRSGSTLTLDGKPFRFSGANVYWLGLDDNVRDAAGQPTYPTRFRTDDAFRAARASGGTVVRTWGGLVGCARCIEPELGVFQDSAFDALDYAVASAARHGQRLVVSLVDNWDYYHGSKHTFTRWRGLPESAFFSDPQVIADYQAYITHVVEHVNPYTGLAYSADPTIMAWETGNEMWCQTCGGNHWDGSWTKAVADHIARVAPRQLVVDGNGTDPACTVGCLHEPSLDIDSVDVVDDHFYPAQTERVLSSAATARRHGKAYLVGEYDWNGARGGVGLSAFLGAVQTSGAAGALMWSVVPHADGSGFVDHADGFQFFFPGRTSDETARTRSILSFARAVGGPAVSGSAPPAPCGVGVVRTGDRLGISWRGAAPAVRYQVQRRPTGGSGGSWTTLTYDAKDQRVATGPLWTDGSSAVVRASGFEYRVAGVSMTGARGSYSAAGRLGAPAACPS